MRPAFALVMAIVCSSCTQQPDIGPVPPDDFPTTGSHGPAGEGGNRIGFYGMASADGAWQFVGWRDSKLGVKCAIRKLYNGKTYCVPTERIIEPVVEDGGNMVLYTDETCSTAFLRWSPDSSCDATPPKYAIQMLKTSTDECGAYNEQHLYRIGEAVEVTAGAKWYHLMEGECAVFADASPGVHRGLVATKISEDEFVEFTETNN